jgi:hypothetical protein
VVPASYQAPSLPRPSSATPEPSLAYPVPAQAKPPKHLFHFIIRYEGEGIVDDNIVKAMKAYIQAETKSAGATALGNSSAQPPATNVAPANGTSETGEKKAEKKDNEKKKDQPEEP